MAASLTAILTALPGTTETRLTLTGSLDEKAAGLLASLRNEIKPGPLVIDLAGIAAINSNGVRVWSEFLRFVETKTGKGPGSGKGGNVTLTSLSTYFVDYANLLPSICGSSTVESFYFPVACKHCQVQMSVLIGAEGAVAANDVGEHRCGVCGDVLADIVPVPDYLCFLLP
jgi:ABC-type transporter Mla MlaB component